MSKCILWKEDCRIALARYAGFPDEQRPAMILTDPAYKISAGGRGDQHKTRAQKLSASTAIAHKKMSGIFGGKDYANDGEIVPVNMDWPEMALAFYAALPDGGIMIAMCEAGNLLAAQTAFDGAGFTFNTLKFWDKMGHGCAGPVSKLAGMKSTEYILIYRKGKFRYLQPGHRGQKQILTSPGFKKIADHPTEKPVSLMAQLIEAHVALGELVFDPMMGAGSTGVAAVMTGRRFVGCEIDPRWYGVAQTRLQSVITGGGGTIDADQGDMFANRAQAAGVSTAIAHKNRESVG